MRTCLVSSAQISLCLVVMTLAVGCQNDEKPKAPPATDSAATAPNAVTANATPDPDVNARDKNGQTLLHHAAWEGRKDTVASLIARGADVNAKENLGGNSALHETDSPDVATLLVAHGADVNAKNKKGLTPLHKAADLSRKVVAEVLLAHGADVNAKDKDGETPLHWAAKHNGDMEHVDLAELLVTHGADVNAKGTDGWTPLHWAACTGHKGDAEFLILHGADVNATNSNGQTPLTLAVQNGHTKIADLLRQHGAKE